jgi:4a-hydroxytetrahydrobiopterin dehydratase
MTALTSSEITAFLEREPEWRLAHGQLEREWTFADFVHAMAFVNRVAEMAEAAGHHPDIDIRYNRVRLALITHDAGGVTGRDAEMAMILGSF